MSQLASLPDIAVVPPALPWTTANIRRSANATKPTAVSTYKPVATAGAGKTAAFSGAALAAAMAVAAFL